MITMVAGEIAVLLVGGAAYIGVITYNGVWETPYRHRHVMVRTEVLMGQQYSLETRGLFDWKILLFFKKYCQSVRICYNKVVATFRQQKISGPEQLM